MSPNPPSGLFAFFSSLEYQVLVTLPLLALSSTFRWGAVGHVDGEPRDFFWACALTAGIQVELSEEQAPLVVVWPVVALLFFLQPVVRGLARYQGQLQPSTQPARETLDSLSLRNSEHSLNEVRYWGDQGVDRMAFVTSVLERLDKQGWPNKSDVG